MTTSTDVLSTPSEADDWALAHVLAVELDARRHDIGVTTEQLAGVLIATVRDYLGERLDEVPGTRIYDGETATWISTQRQVREWLDAVTATDE